MNRQKQLELLPLLRDVLRLEEAEDQTGSIAGEDEMEQKRQMAWQRLSWEMQDDTPRMRID